jgi:hypothetical protein
VDDRQNIAAGQSTGQHAADGVDGTLNPQVLGSNPKGARFRSGERKGERQHRPGDRKKPRTGPARDGSGGRAQHAEDAS